MGVKLPNRWGLHDMLGGVWEWCWDLFDEDVYGPYRIIRGGGWNDPHWSCRAGVRRKTNPVARFDDLGFRLARNAAPSLSGASRSGHDRCDDASQRLPSDSERGPPEDMAASNAAM